MQDDSCRLLVTDLSGVVVDGNICMVVFLYYTDPVIQTKEKHNVRKQCAKRATEIAIISRMSAFPLYDSPRMGLSHQPVGKLGKLCQSRPHISAFFKGKGEIIRQHCEKVI